MHADKFAFRRGAVKPMECLRGGWQLVREQYWLFLGITLAGVFLGSMGPMGLLLGPAMCGIHLCLLRQERGLKVSFDMLFNGFNYFGQSFVATLIMIVPTFALVLGIYVLMIAGAFALIGLMPAQNANAPPDPALIGAIIGGVAVFFVFIVSVAIVLTAVFFFTFPLIVDRELSGWEAVTLSFRAAWGNLGGLLWLIVLTMLLDFAGALACYVGAIFVMPIHYAMVTIAFRQVFPPIDDDLVLPSTEFASLEQRPPAIDGATGITAG